VSDEKVNELQRKLYTEIQAKRKLITRRIDVVEHAQILRRELKKKFPEILWRVKSARFAGGNSVTAYHVGGDHMHPRREEINAFVKKFDGFESDLMDCRYNVGFEYEGERIQGASFCSYNGKN